MNVKTVFLAILMSVAAQCAHANCVIPIMDEPQTHEAFHRFGRLDFPNYDVVCQKLQQADAEILILANAAHFTHPDGKPATVTSALLTVVDRRTGIEMLSNYSFSSSISNVFDEASTDRQMIMDIEEAGNNWTGLDDALAKLKNQIDRLGEARQ